MTVLEQELAECLRQCRSVLQTALTDQHVPHNPTRQRVLERRIASADRVLAKVPRA